MCFFQPWRVLSEMRNWVRLKMRAVHKWVVSFWPWKANTKERGPFGLVETTKEWGPFGLGNQTQKSSYPQTRQGEVAECRPNFTAPEPQDYDPVPTDLVTLGFVPEGMEAIESHPRLRLGLSPFVGANLFFWGLPFGPTH